MVTAFGQIRTLVLAAAVLFASLAALGTQVPQEAAAAGPCTLYESLYYNSRGEIWSSGLSNCSRSNFQKITVQMKMNGSVITERTSQGWTDSIQAFVGMSYCRSGATYQTVVIHQYGDGISSPVQRDFITSGAPRRLC